MTAPEPKPTPVAEVPTRRRVDRVTTAGGVKMVPTTTHVHRAQCQAFCLSMTQAAVATRTNGGGEVVTLLTTVGTCLVAGVDSLLALRDAIDYALSGLPTEQQGGDA